MERELLGSKKDGNCERTGHPCKEEIVGHIEKHRFNFSPMYKFILKINFG